MKGFIAICLEKVSDILDADLEIPVHFAFSYDEEVGCLGVVGLLDALRQRPVLPKCCIIGEPTSMEIIRAHKGMLFKRCCVRGKSAHSSLVHQGVNAVSVAAKLIHKVDDVQQRIQRQGPFDEAFEPPYTTLHCGVVKGGTVNNIIPNRCEFDFEIRNLPEHSPLALFSEIETYGRESLQSAMHAVDVSSGIDWQTLADFPGMDTPADNAVIKLAAKALGCEIKTGKVSYGTEGGHFQNAGIAAVVCGPGSIEQAHKPDEYIGLSQIARGEQFLDSLLITLKSH